MRFGSPRSGFPLATPRSPRGRGAAAAAPHNHEKEDTMSRRYSDDKARFEEANRRNKDCVFDALSKAGIMQVLVAFDGEDDQGQMEHASAQADGKTVEFPAVTLSLWIADFGATQLSSRSFDLREAVEQLCYGYLEEQHGGWEIDDGSFGEFTFDVAKRKITLEFYGRIVEAVRSSETF
jgi:hypothetical protein